MSFFTTFLVQFFQLFRKSSLLVFAFSFGFLSVTFAYRGENVRSINLAQNQVRVSGKVTDGKGKPLQYISVKLTDYDRSTYSDANGNYSIGISRRNVESLRIGFSMVGKTTVDSTIILTSLDNYALNVVLEDLCFFMKINFC